MNQNKEASRETRGRTGRVGGRPLRVAWLWALAAVIALCAACSSGGGNEGGSAAEGNNANKPSGGNAQAIVELNAFFPGDTPVDFDRVLAAVNDKMAADGVGAKLNIQFVPWDDYGNMTTLKTTAGEDFDMFLDAPWLHINQMISSGAIIPLDDYVEQAPNLKSSIPQQMWDENKFGGKIYGIPLGTTQGVIQGFIVRKDLREKYGLPEIKTLDDFEKFLYAVKEHESDIVPFGIDGRYGADIFSYFNPKYYAGEPSYFSIAAGTYADIDGHIMPSWEFPGVADLYRKMRTFYQDGIFEKNVLQQQNAVELFNKGRFGATLFTADTVMGMQYLDALKTDGVELEIVMPFAEGAKPYSTFQQWNFLVVHSKSKHPELVMKVMDWLSIRENHDLLEYGVENTDWKAVGDDGYEIINDSQYVFPGFTISWRPSLIRTPQTMLGQEWFDAARKADSFVKSPAAGFTADLEPIKTEVAQFNTIATEVGLPLAAGVMDTEQGLKALGEQAKAAGMDKIVAEIQKQYTEFLQSR